MRNVLLLHQDVIEILVSAALVLHNFLRESHAYCPTGPLDTESVTGEVLTGWWCQDLSFSAMGPLEIPTRGHNSSVDAKHVRDVFKDYFAHEGEVECRVGKMLKSVVISRVIHFSLEIEYDNNY